MGPATTSAGTTSAHSASHAVSLTLRLRSHVRRAMLNGDDGDGCVAFTTRLTEDSNAKEPNFPQVRF